MKSKFPPKEEHEGKPYVFVVGGVLLCNFKLNKVLG